jgi:hypothetical protein
MNVKGSYLGWVIETLGPFYSVVIPLAGLSVFFAACFVVMRSRRPGMIAAWLVLVPLPLLVGFQAAMFRWMSVSAELSMSSSGVPLTVAQIGEISFSGLVPLCVGLLEIWPAFVILTVGLIVRTYQSGRNQHTSSP